MSDGPLAKKMKLKPGLKAAVVNAPENYIEGLNHDSDISNKLGGKFDWIQVFVKDKKELASLAPKAASSLKPDALLWLSFPKGTSKLQTDLTRDKGWGVIRNLDLKFINLISVNETWSAFALRTYKEGEEKQSFQLGE
jgi:hypothetical protein